MSGLDYAWLPRIQLGKPTAETGRVIVSMDDVPFIRIGGDVADILCLAQRNYPVVDSGAIASALGTSAEAVEQTLQAVGASPVLTRTQHANRRLRFRAPFAIQFTLFDPSIVLAHVPVLVSAVRSPWWWRTQIALSAVGGVVLVLVALTPDSSLHRPMSGAQYIGVFVALFLAVFVHEFAHAITLVAFGGRSRRLGVMLFYLAPAFFCDVSDAWHLPPNRRVKVATAGILMQTTLAAAAALIALLVPPAVAVGFDVFAVLCLLYGLINLVPLVKLDGYIALVGYLDRPNLRANAIQALRSATARILLGERKGSDVALANGSANRGQSVGLILFGLGCTLFPVVLVVGTGLTVNAYLASWGAFGAWVTIGVFAFIAVLGAVLMWREAVRIVRRATSTGRASVVMSVTIVVMVVTVVALPLPQQVAGGVLDEGTGHLLAIVDATTTVPTGTSVDVYRSAVFPSQQVGTALVTGPEFPCTVALDALAPMTGTGLRSEARCFTVSTSADLPETSVAVVTSNGLPLVQQVLLLVNRLTAQ